MKVGKAGPPNHEGGNFGASRPQHASTTATAAARHGLKPETRRQVFAQGLSCHGHLHVVDPKLELLFGTIDLAD